MDIFILPLSVGFLLTLSLCVGLVLRLGWIKDFVDLYRYGFGLAFFAMTLITGFLVLLKTGVVAVVGVGIVGALMLVWLTVLMLPAPRK